MIHTNLEKCLNAISEIESSHILDKMYDADAVEVDDFGFSRNFIYEHDIVQDIVLQIKNAMSDDKSSGKKVDELLSEIVFEASFVDDDMDKFEYLFSLKEILDAEMKKDGSVHVLTKGEDGLENFKLVFFKVSPV